MTDRLADISERIEGIRQLGTVVNAMRGIAASRAVQARAHLSAVDGYTTTIATAIGRVLALVPAPRPEGGHRMAKRALVLFCAEQGFAGAFSERVLDAVGAGLGTAELFLIGARGAAAALERDIAIGWKTSMPWQSQGVPKLADRIVQALYRRIASGEIDRLEIAFTRWQAGQGCHIEHKQLFPLALSIFPRPTSVAAPLVNVNANMLLAELTAEYLHAQLCDAALHAFASENEARMEAMAAAHSQIERQLATLRGAQRQIRQEEITAEIIELAAGETASRITRKRTV